MDTKQYEIQKAGVRKSLPARKQPYWKHLEKTGYLGYRKTDFGFEAWAARWRDESGKTHQKALGRVTLHNDYTAAKNAAEAWFKRCDRGTLRAGTVEEACKAYVANLRALKPATVHFTEGRFKKFVYDTPFGQKKRETLRQIDVQNWRDSLLTEKRTKQTVNRMLAMFKAAMNCAHEDGLPDAWSRVKKYPVKAGVGSCIKRSLWRRAYPRPGPARFLHDRAGDADQPRPREQGVDSCRVRGFVGGRGRAEWGVNDTSCGRAGRRNIELLDRVLHAQIRTVTARDTVDSV